LTKAWGLCTTLLFLDGATLFVWPLLSATESVDALDRGWPSSLIAASLQTPYMDSTKYSDC
jgi:hypothetical protein